MILVVLSFFLSACGSQSGNKTNFNSDFSLKFKIAKTKFKISLPPGWTSIKPEKNIIFQAVHGESSIVVSQIPSIDPQKSFSIASDKFFEFKKLEFSENFWRFRLKKNSFDQSRDFAQKIIQIPRTENAILVSCSTKTELSSEVDCEKIVKTLVSISS